MPTPILPTKTQLKELVFTPKQLIADDEVEQFLTVTNEYDFILGLITAYRSGAKASWADTGVTTGAETYTEFVYFGTLTTVNTLINFLTHADYGYGYTVKIARDTAWEARTTAISVTTESDPYKLLTGPNINKYALLVSWA